MSRISLTQKESKNRTFLITFGKQSEGFRRWGKFMPQWLLIAMTALASVNSGQLAAEPAAVPKMQPPLGMLGSDLDFLASFYTPPQTPAESNHYIDLWAGKQLRAITALNRLTNNRALFINSHGQGFRGKAGTRFAYFPHQSLLRDGQKVPYYSAQDLAQIVGPASADKIHNILIASCDSEGCFSSAELRKYFVNATNITHVTSGKPGFQPMFFQAMVSPASEIQPLFEIPTRTADGSIEYQIETHSAPKARRLFPYVADLYRAGEAKPFKVQVAGRELLTPPLVAFRLSQLSKSVPASR